MLREDSMPLGTVKKGNDDHLSVKHLLPKTKVCEGSYKISGVVWTQTKQQTCPASEYKNRPILLFYRPGNMPVCLTGS